MKSRDGFTLLEILVTIAIIAVVMIVVSSNLGGRRRFTDLTTTRQDIAGTLRQAQNRSVIQDQNVSWGVYFSNSTNTAPFYALFSNSYSTATVVNRYALPTDILFSTSSIASGATFTITFAPISGLPSASTSIVINLIGGGANNSGASVTRATIGISGAGLISD